MLGDKKVDAEIEEVVKKVCKYLPIEKQNEVTSYYFAFFFLRKAYNFKLKFKSVQCNEMVNIYGQSIINMLKAHMDSGKMCSKMALCSSNDYFAMTFKNSREARSINELKKCTPGESSTC